MDLEGKLEKLDNSLSVMNYDAYVNQAGLNLCAELNFTIPKTQLKIRSDNFGFLSDSLHIFVDIM